jgi:sialate O-acetylesterase
MRLKTVLFFCFVLFGFRATSQIKLPRLISDGMVLQRNTPLTIWGWSSVEEKIELNFKGKNYTTQADKEGKWQIILPAQPAGGPFEMKLKGKNELAVKDIFIGDVWICSGQSNMELDMRRVKDKYPTTIANSGKAIIRQFLVPDKYDFKSEYSDLDGGNWQQANPDNIFSFTAVGYFFALELHNKYQVPIGLVNAALGGSPAEAWISENALKEFPNLYQEAVKFKNDKLIDSIEVADRNRTAAWYRELNSKDAGIKKWNLSNFDDTDWSQMNIPGFWADQPIGNVNGSVWFRRKINVRKSMTGRAGKIWMGRIVDADSVFINNSFVGTVSYQYPPRKYELASGLLKEGENTIAVRVINSSGKGGFVSDKPYFLAVDQDTIDLKGEWKYKLGATMSPLAGTTAIRWKPVGLFNRMIAPLLKYNIKGAIWYQGESNTGRAKEYQTLFTALIRNWRDRWGQGDFPFLFVQLANFMDAKPNPSESQWAELREAQLKTLAVPNTAMAVTIDIGEWNDIHPLNKEAVGKRLALAAQKMAYGEKNVVYSGPIYKSHRTEGNKIVITFDHADGMVAKGSGELKYFAIAGSDKKFVWAKTTIKGNTVTVWSNDVPNPVAVRYAWADNPEEANLYNRAGLPASPFRIGD